MIILLSKVVRTDPPLLQLTKELWTSHPLRSYQADRLLEVVTLTVEEGETYGLNPEGHPQYLLRCAPNSPYSSISSGPAITHELTHLIDRFDPVFIARRSPEEAWKTLQEIPRGNANNSVRRAFDTYWNAYIDGRLERRGIIVETIESRIDEKIGGVARKGAIVQGEEESVLKTWRSEPQTLDVLIELALRYPYRRAEKYWIEYPENSA